MKYLIYSTLLLLALVARADELLPEGTEAESKAAEETSLSEPVPPAEVNPTLALPVESPTVATATAVSTSTEVVAPAVAEEKPAQEPVDPVSAEETAAKPAGEEPTAVAEEPAPVPVDVTAQQPVPPPVAVEVPNYGPSAEEGYGSVGLKNEGQIMEVGGDKKTEESAAEDGDRKTSSLPEESEAQQ